MITRPPPNLTREDDHRDLAFLDAYCAGASIRAATKAANIPHMRARRLIREYWQGERGDV